MMIYVCLMGHQWEDKGLDTCGIFDNRPEAEAYIRLTISDCNDPQNVVGLVEAWDLESNDFKGASYIIGEAKP